MNRYRQFMNELTNGRGCDECPLYHNGACNRIAGEDNLNGLDCGEVLFRYLNPWNEED